MRNYSAQLWLGVWLFLVPFLGLPSAWRMWLVGLTGLVLLAVSGIRLRRERLSAAHSDIHPERARRPDESSAPHHTDTPR